MAYYVKTCRSGGEHDVRGYKYAIYHCDVCGEDSTFTITTDFQTRPRPCKNCKSLGLDDHIVTLNANKQNILKQISDLNARLIQLDIEINENKRKINIKSQIENITK